jgi:hypothetical protein
VEDALAEDRLRRGEVGVIEGVEGAVAQEDAEGNQGVGVAHEQVAEALGNDDHGRDGAPEPGKASWKETLEELPRRVLETAPSERTVTS